MELRIKALLKEQGLRMADLADRMGMNQSNLVRSLSKNPTLSTLQDIANALHVPLHELFTSTLPSRPKGVVITGGRTFALVEMQSVVQIPSYCNYAELRKDVSDFIDKCIAVTDGKTKAFCAFVGGYELVSVVYDRANGRFILTLYFGKMESETFYYEKMEYTEWQDKKPILNKDQMLQDIISDIENVVPLKFDDDTAPANREEEGIA